MNNQYLWLALFTLVIVILFSNSSQQAGGYYYGPAFNPVRGRTSTVTVPGDTQILGESNYLTSSGGGRFDPHVVPLGPAGNPPVRILYSGFGNRRNYDGNNNADGSGWGPNSWIGTSSYSFGPYRLPYLNDRLKFSGGQSYWDKIYRRPLWVYEPYRRPFYSLLYQKFSGY